MAEPFERRRYSAVLLSHPKLATFRDVVTASRNGIGDSVAVPVGQPGWTARRVEWLSARSHYPQHVVDPTTRERQGGYAHDFYVAVRAKGVMNGSLPCFLVASPYVRLLDSLLRTVMASLDHPLPSFGSVRMEDAVRYFSTATVESPHARRVTMQVFSGVTVDLVSLSGRNPLHWDLMQAIFTPELAAPYSLGIEVNKRDTTRVNFDRHGNFWWYQAEELLLVNALDLVDRIAEAELVGTSRTIPLKRVSEEE